MMRTAWTFCIIVAFILTPHSFADLSISTYNGVESVLDEEANRYWYRNLADFNGMDYFAQIDAIAGIAPPVDNTTGSWHMASYDEMAHLWTHGIDPLINAFTPTYSFERYIWGSDGTYNAATHMHWKGRYELTWPPYFHYYDGFELIWDDDLDELHSQFFYPLPGNTLLIDHETSGIVGAWAVFEPDPVPVHGAFLLGFIGMGYAGHRLRRKRRA